MADLSDITAALVSIVGGILYPPGTSGIVSTFGVPCKIFEGWPLADQLDLDMAGNCKSSTGVVSPSGVGPITNISIYPLPGATVAAFQVMNDPYITIPPIHGLTASISGQTVNFSGSPSAGEFVTIVADGTIIYSRNGSTLAAILAALSADAVAQYPGVSVSGNSITLGTDRLDVRIGGIATMAQVTHRQKHSIMVTVWAPDPVTRSKLASAIDVSIKANNLKITLPDTSQAIVIYDRTMQTDNWEVVSVYRRDLIYAVEYATLETFPGYEVTSVTTTGDVPSIT